MKRLTARSFYAIVLILAGTCWLATSGVGLADWPVFGQDAARSGHAAGAAISLANVRKLHQRWVAHFESPADATPIYVSRVTLSKGRKADMLFETARNGTTYGVDASSGSIVWTHSTTGPNITTSTPAVDPSRKWLYAPGVDGFVHKLAVSTGAELHDGGFPIRITWAPDVEKDAAALNVADGYLYAVTSGYFGDQGNYVGHVVTVRLRGGSVRVLNTLCGDIPNLLGHGHDCPQLRSGIWSRSGAVVDPDPSMHGRIYVATGNGQFNADQGGHNYGDSVLAISADGSTLEDYFTPNDQAQLEAEDADLGSTAPAILPSQRRSFTPLMAIQGGKDGILHLLDRTHLGGVGGAIQEYDLGTGVYSAPAVWRDGKSATWIFVGTSSTVTALRLETDAKGKSELRKAWAADIGGTSPVVADGTVFIATDNALNALDAHTGKLVWSSGDESAGGSIGGIHWESPIVVNGWVYVSDEAGHLTAYSV
jgi:outer membrane protein assembly factor BamB